jgi:hypothetical protein
MPKGGLRRSVFQNHNNLNLQRSSCATACSEHRRGGRLALRRSRSQHWPVILPDPYTWLCCLTERLAQAILCLKRRTSDSLRQDRLGIQAAVSLSLPGHPRTRINHDRQNRRN